MIQENLGFFFRDFGQNMRRILAKFEIFWEYWKFRGTTDLDPSRVEDEPSWRISSRQNDENIQQPPQKNWNVGHLELWVKHRTNSN